MNIGEVRNALYNAAERLHEQAAKVANACDEADAASGAASSAFEGTGRVELFEAMGRLMQVGLALSDASVELASVAAVLEENANTL